MKFYIMQGPIAEAINDSGINLEKLSDKAWRELSEELNTAQFIQKFNDNSLNPSVDYLRIIE